MGEILDLSIGSDQRHIQKIGASMIQSLSVLQMAATDVREFVLRECEKNPAIELAEPIYTNKSSADGDDFKHRALEAIGYEKPMEDYILDQVPEWSEDKKNILLAIVGKLDEKGFLNDSFDGIAAALNVNVDDVQWVSNELKHLVPHGLSSRNLKEALLIQLEHLTLNDDSFKKLAIEIITKYCDDLLHGFFKKIAKGENLPLEIIERIGKLILRLNFSPLSTIKPERTMEVIPDVKIFKRDGEWVVESSYDYCPRIRFSKMYKDLFSSTADNDAMKYMQTYARRWRTLSSALEKRRTTLYKISKSILNNQIQFFEYGPKWIKKLSLDNVAKEIGVAVSTVSRAVDGKYSDTPFGIVRISKFFDSGIGDYSSTFIKNEMKKIVKDSKAGLSDQKIVNLLKEKGIAVARRTISKYRQQENLPNSRIRKI